MSRTLDPPGALTGEGDEEYAKSLSNRQVQMIAIGGAIGSGCSSARAASSRGGPSLVLSYAICGIAAFFVMRALGELVLHRPTRAVSSPTPASSSARGPVSPRLDVLGELGDDRRRRDHRRGDLHARWLPDVPQWITALAALGGPARGEPPVRKLFGELEFWFAVIKVLAIVTFLFVAIGLVLTGAGVGARARGRAQPAAHGGFLPARPAGWR